MHSNSHQDTKTLYERDKRIIDDGIKVLVFNSISILIWNLPKSLSILHFYWAKIPLISPPQVSFRNLITFIADLLVHTITSAQHIYLRVCVCCGGKIPISKSSSINGNLIRLWRVSRNRSKWEFHATIHPNFPREWLKKFKIIRKNLTRKAENINVNCNKVIKKYFTPSFQWKTI